MKKFFNCILVAFAAYVVVITQGVNATRLPTVKTCPNLPSPSFCIDKFDFCKTDADCGLTNYKCCSNGCKKICAFAVIKRKTLQLSETRNRVRPGNCPVLPIRKFCLDHESNECSNDFECKEYYKCCSNGCTRRCAVSTSRKAVGSGSKKINATCPHFPTRSNNCQRDISNQCSADKDCSDQGNSFKCCWDGCRKICLDPSEIQQTDGRGACPVMRRQTTCNSFQHECIEDKECNRGQKCCSDGCTMKCVNVKDSTPSKKNDTATPNKFRLDDKCPFVARPIRCPVSSLHQCYRNEECPRPLMCCSDGCRNICLDITKDTSLLLCPIVRRPDVCSNVQDKCSSLHHCGRGQKCCNDGCIFRCFGKRGFKPQNEGPPPTTVFPATTSRGPTSDPTPVLTTTQHHTTTDITAELSSTVLSTTNSPTEVDTPVVTTEVPSTVSTASIATKADTLKVTTEVPTTISTTTSPTKIGTTTENVVTATDSRTHYAAAAAPEKGSSKPGICPMVSRFAVQCPSNDECDNDKDCAGNKKCCKHYCNRKVCVEPPSKEEEERLVNTLHRPGKCRKLKKPDICEKKTQVECNYDVDCSNINQKCCSDGCNRQCVDPEVPAPVIPVNPPTAFPIRPGNILGRCPPYSPARNCPDLVIDDCTCSTDCGSGYKCCFDGCKRICRKPAGNECSAQLDIVYLMDTSGSISKSDYRREKQFVKDLARIFRVGRDASQSAVTIYNDDPHELIKLGKHTSPEEFSKAIDDIPYLHGRTRIDKALKSSLETFRTARPNIRKVLVLLTDGRQTQDPDSVPLNISSQPLKDMGVKIYAVGVGQEIDRGELEVITGSPDAVFTVDSFTALLGESQTIAEKACGDVIAGKICIRGVDLGFVVDSSESITDDDFIKEKNAIKAISDEFVIAPKSTRVGVVVYSSEPKLSIDFDQYASNLEFNRAVNSLPHMQSHTRLDKALRYAASNLYNKRRQANPAIVIVMTDGKQTPGAGSLTVAVQPLRDLGVRVFAVGVGPKVSRKELEEIVERNDDIFTVGSFSQLIKEAKKITERACPAPSETKLPTLASSTTAAPTTAAPTTAAPSTSLPTTALATPTESPSTPNPCTYFMDIIFVLDSSRSMDVRQYIKQKEFVKKLARIFDVGKGTRAASIIYSDDPILSIDFDLCNTQECFLDKVDKLPYIMQRTRIDKALKMASQVLKDSRPGFPKAVIIMTDGRQTRDPGYTKLDVAAAPLHEAGARVLVVGIGPAISVDELTKMVMNKTSDIFTVSSFDGLVNATTAVAIKSCNGTIPPYEPDSCPDTFDLAFVMDSSGSMKISNYNKEKGFVKNIAGRFAVGENKVKLALLSFSDWPNSLVTFNSSSSVSIYGFNAAVDNAEYMKGRTRIDRALAAASDLFKLGRRNVPKVMVFMTDGQQSSDPGSIPIETAVKPLSDQNVKIIVVGIGKDINISQLYALASQRGRDVTRVDSFDDLDKLKNSFAQTICRKIEEAI